jgi:hypothetical protein
MKLENWQLIAIVVGAFAGIIILDIATKYRGDETFRANFPKLPSAKFAKSIAPQLQQEEHEYETESPYEDS